MIRPATQKTRSATQTIAEKSLQRATDIVYALYMPQAKNDANKFPTLTGMDARPGLGVCPRHDLTRGRYVRLNLPDFTTTTNMPDEELYYNASHFYSGPTSRDKCGRYVEPLNIGAAQEWEHDEEEQKIRDNMQAQDSEPNT